MNLENYTNINIFKKHYEQRQVVESGDFIFAPGDMIEHAHNHLAAPKQQAGFNPYQNNEGTVIGKSFSPQPRFWSEIPQWFDLNNQTLNLKQTQKFR